jgi:phosphotransferase system HPr (HPr) family protein
MNGYKIITERFTISNPMGLDLRCVRMLVQSALQFDAEIEMKCRGDVVDGKSMLDVLALGIPCGAMVDVSLYGREAQQAHQALQFLFNHAFASEVLPEIRGIAVA